MYQNLHATFNMQKSMKLRWLKGTLKDGIVEDCFFRERERQREREKDTQNVRQWNIYQLIRLLHNRGQFDIPTVVVNLYPYGAVPITCLSVKSAHIYEKGIERFPPILMVRW